MSTWTVRLKFINTRVLIPEEDAFLPGLPRPGDVWRTTPAMLDRGEGDELKDSVAWRVVSCEVILFAHHKHLALITLTPYTESEAGE